MSLNRRGFVLIELLVATLLSGILAVLIGGILARSAVQLRGSSERMALEHSFRVSLSAAGAILEPLGSDSVSGADLTFPASTSLVARVIRATGVLCGAAADHVLARAGPDWWHGVRGPVRDRDSLLIAAVSGPDHWIAVPLSASPASATCPDGAAAWQLPTTISSAALASIGEGSPLRVFEPVELRFYASSGATWVGLRLIGTGEAIQPLAGPFAPLSTGFEYRDRDGGAAAQASDVAIIALNLLGMTERAGGVGLARLPSSRSDGSAVAIALRGGK